jgi:hypothetical protein
MKLLFGKSKREAEAKGKEEKTVLFVCVEMQIEAKWLKHSLENMLLEVI